MDIDFKIANQLILAGLKNRSVLSPTLRVVKNTEKAGEIDQSVDVQLPLLTNVTAETYTREDKLANENYKFNAFKRETKPITLNDEIYASVFIDGWDSWLIGEENLATYAPFFNELGSVVNTKLETTTATALNAMAATAGYDGAVAAGSLSEQGEEIVSDIQDFSFDLDENGVAEEDRFLVVGRDVAKRLLANKDILNADKSANAGLALQKAVIGEVGGFTVVKSGKVGNNAMIGYNRDAFGVVSREPGVNKSAEYSEVITDPTGVIDLRANVLGLGARNATGFIVSTFFTVADLDSAKRARKVVYNFATA